MEPPPEPWFWVQNLHNCRNSVFNNFVPWGPMLTKMCKSREQEIINIKKS